MAERPNPRVHESAGNYQSKRSKKGRKREERIGKGLIVVRSHRAMGASYTQRRRYRGQRTNESSSQHGHITAQATRSVRHPEEKNTTSSEVQQKCTRRYNKKNYRYKKQNHQETPKTDGAVLANTGIHRKIAEETLAGESSETTSALTEHSLRDATSPENEPRFWVEKWGGNSRSSGEL